MQRGVTRTNYYCDVMQRGVTRTNYYCDVMQRGVTHTEATYNLLSTVSIRNPLR
jgi:hypothetical protein